MFEVLWCSVFRCVCVLSNTFQNYFWHPSHSSIFFFFCSTLSLIMMGGIKQEVDYSLWLMQTHFLCNRDTQQ